MNGESFNQNSKIRLHALGKLVGAAALIMPFSPALSTPPVMLLSVSSVSTVTMKQVRKWEREKRREYTPKCRKIWSRRNDLERAIAEGGYNQPMLIELSHRFRDGDGGCRASLTISAALMDRVVGFGVPEATDRPLIEELIGLHERIGEPGSLQRIVELKRWLWLFGSFYGDEAELQWSASARRAFVATDQIWQYLNSRDEKALWANKRLLEAYLDPDSTRYDPSKGIDRMEAMSHPESAFGSAFVVRAAQRLVEGDEVPKDAGRAERLVAKLTPVSDEARQFMFELLAPRLDSGDEAIRSATAAQLMTIATRPSDKAIRERLVPYFAERLKIADAAHDAAGALTSFVEAKTEIAMEPLRPWLAQRLKGATAEQLFAREQLARLVRTGSRDADVLLHQDIARTGGLIELDGVDGLAGFNRAFITDGDYPPRALREKIEGFVSVELLVSPTGTVVDGRVEDGAPAQLGDQVRRIAIRRLRFRQHLGHYVRLKLPVVQFRLPACKEGTTQTPAMANAIIVDGHFCRRSVAE